MADMAQLLNSHMSAYQKSVQTSYNALDSSMSSNIQRASSVGPGFQAQLKETLSDFDSHQGEVQAQITAGREKFTTPTQGASVDSLATRATTIRDSQVERVDRFGSTVQKSTFATATVLREGEPKPETNKAKTVNLIFFLLLLLPPPPASQAIVAFSKTAKESFTSLTETVISGSNSVTGHLDEMNQGYTPVCRDVCTTLEGGQSSLEDHAKAEKAGLLGVQTRVSRLLEQQIQVRLLVVPCLYFSIFHPLLGS